MTEKKNIILTNTRKQINNLDTLPVYDRSLVDYKKYNNQIGHAGVKHSMAVQATRGCPYRCLLRCLQNCCIILEDQLIIFIMK